MSQEEFRRRWRAAWMMLHMDKLRVLSMFSKADGPTKAEELMNLPAEIDALIDRMWNDFQTKKQEVKK